MAGDSVSFFALCINVCLIYAVTWLDSDLQIWERRIKKKKKINEKNFTCFIFNAYSLILPVAHWVTPWCSPRIKTESSSPPHSFALSYPFIHSSERSFSSWTQLQILFVPNLTGGGPRKARLLFRGFQPTQDQDVLYIQKSGRSNQVRGWLPQDKKMQLMLLEHKHNIPLAFNDSGEWCFGTLCSVAPEALTDPSRLAYS